MATSKIHDAVQRLQETSRCQPLQKRGSLSKRKACDGQSVRYVPCEPSLEKTAQSDGHTTIAMPAHWTKALNSNTEDTMPHPCTLRCTPPAKMTMNETSVHNSTTTPNEVRKPTVRHMLQKDASFVQSLSRGKGMHVPVSAEQRR